MLSNIYTILVGSKKYFIKLKQSKYYFKTQSICDRIFYSYCFENKLPGSNIPFTIFKCLRDFLTRHRIEARDETVKKKKKTHKKYYIVINKSAPSYLISHPLNLLVATARIATIYRYINKM